MDNLATLNNTDLSARTAKTFPAPLLNLVIAASILNRLTHGKAFLQSPWVPFRPIFGYYPQQLPSIWYPIHPFAVPPRLYPSLTTNVPQLQAPPLSQQQIVHIHEAPTVPEETEPYENTYQTTYPESNSIYQEEASNDVELQVLENTTRKDEQEDVNVAEPTKKEYSTTTFSNEVILEAEGSENKENFLLSPLASEVNESFPIISIGGENDTFSSEEALNDTVNKETTTTGEYLIAATPANYEAPIEAHPCSNYDLQMAEASNHRRRQPLPYNYNYDYYSDISANRQRQRPTVAKRQTTRPRPYRQPTRINSKKGNYRQTTPQYEDDYDITTRYNRRKTTPKRNVYQRRTTPSYEYEYYEEERPNRRRPQGGQPRTTTTSHDQYYEDDYYKNEDDYQYSRQKLMNRPRQETSTTTTTTEPTTTTTETPPTTTTEPPTEPPVTNATTVGYPYYGNSGYGNISITYRPPYAGYGPSNGNEHISITYGPPTGQNFAPLLDNWYNQYTKNSVIKRIQELLMPNNFYSPQYDADANYNESTF